ncbi:uncharacterized membrane protein YgdD (TMEM256/DUF423 family) [Methylopila capsulata]|nr:DUF423 domain-containing protein [Methylopila capsulata]MBM7852078.1 uncharacterized membrane protein YgdD (TMEM256/DUF423 family) [Methylopila capsulata]
MSHAPSRSALLLVILAGLYGAAGVALAAVAAHRLDSPLLGAASNFLMLNAAALVALAAAAHAFAAGARLGAPAWAIALGTLLFCGDLTLRALNGASPWPMAAPTGGTLMILGWLGVAIGAALAAAGRSPRA